MNPFSAICCRMTLGLSLIANLIASAGALVRAAETPDSEPRMFLTKHCFACHAEGADEGNISLDELLDARAGDAGKDRAEQNAGHHEAWLGVWRNIRAQTMPPSTEPQPSEAERSAMVEWIERDVFRLDPKNPDPGRVVIRRLNRAEYANTIQDLFGIRFDAAETFPADDTGYGFDTIGEVLTLSPLLMEKYLEAAQAIVEQVVALDGPRIPVRYLDPQKFVSPGKSPKTAKYMAFAKPLTVELKRHVDHSGKHRLKLDLQLRGSDEATSSTARLIVRLDGKELKSVVLGWDGDDRRTLTVETPAEKGDHTVALELVPLDPPRDDEKPLNLVLRNGWMEGPLDGSVREYAYEHRRVLMDGLPSADSVKRREYARKILRHFAERAFRRPVDEPTLDRLCELAVPSQGSKLSFEQGIGDALTAILISPRFLYRAETLIDPAAPADGPYAPVDEYALASRLSYFLWSSLPDDELLKLAREHRLRAELRPQVERMLRDSRSRRFVENFVGQWLQTRDVETINIDPRKALGIRDLGDASKIFSRRVRESMRQETESLFAHLLAENLSAEELLTAHYTFLNEPLAKFYDLPDVDGDEMRRVELPADSHRGGLLTHGGILVVTSNPTRTSPVKRGLFVLDNLLGTPPPPPPPDVPELEAAGKKTKGKLSLRQLLEVHRQEAICASCHARMDPLGFALEAYDAIGQWREQDNGQKIETAGQLITGEKFANVQELSQVIATRRRDDYYRCLAEKMLIYAVGRGTDYHDAPTITAIVARMKQDKGQMRSLVAAIVESAPFQLRRRGDLSSANPSAVSAK